VAVAEPLLTHKIELVGVVVVAEPFHHRMKLKATVPVPVAAEHLLTHKKLKMVETEQAVVVRLLFLHKTMKLVPAVVEYFLQCLLHMIQKKAVAELDHHHNQFLSCILTVTAAMVVD
jgi:hypothetical protein